MRKYKVGVVTVTYGNRWGFLKQVLERVLGFEEITDIVIVDNASVYDVKSVVSAEKISVLTNKENQGSAGGYKQGIEYCYQHTEVDFIWLLDDDNLPMQDCLNKLLQEWSLIGVADNQKALFCLREDRMSHVNIARGENPNRYYLVPNNFLGFSIFRVLYNKYNKFKGAFKKNRSFEKRVTIPYVPYGGLLIHRSLINVIGFPDERFFLYVDDSEYSYRITQNGGNIWLIPACRVVDIDKSQGINYKKRCFHSQLLDEWSFRTYYHVRNRVYFYKRVAVRNNFVFRVNKALYLTYLHLISIISSKQIEYKKLLNAIDDGIKFRLGKANTDKF